MMKRMDGLLRTAFLMYFFHVHIVQIECVPKGHLQPFGSHRDPSVITEELDHVPHPIEFYEKYVKPHKPVVFRGAAKKSRAYHDWTEQYLIQEYGDLTVRLEAKYEGDNRVPYGEGGILGRDTIRHFITHYQNHSTYVISQVPGLMERDVTIPPCLLCGSFAKSIQEVHLFLSAGGGKTLIHQDPYENIHCVFNGTKQWLLIDPKQTESVYLYEAAAREFGGFSEVDVDAVDFIKFPKMVDVEYSKLTMNKGDCIYMPSGHLHQVRSNGYMNSAVAIWFSFFTKSNPFDGSDCKDEVDFKPMNEVDILWRYDGVGLLPQGHMDIYVLRTVLLTSADEDGKIWLERFTSHFLHGQDDEDLEYYVDMRKQFTDLLDPTERGFVTVEEVKGLTIDQLKELLLTFDPTDVSNTVDFEYSHIDAHSIINLALGMITRESDDTFSREEFVNRYVSQLGGTPQKAEEILSFFETDETNSISKETVRRNIEKAVEKYEDAPEHDPTFEHLWFDHLVQHDEL